MIPADVEVSYKNSNIVTLTDYQQSATLTTAGKYLEDNIVVTNNTKPMMPYCLRPDAELIWSESKDSLLIEDEGVTLPAATTTATNLLPGSPLSLSITLDTINYYYFVHSRTLTVPIYNSSYASTFSAGRQAYQVGAHFTELVHYAPYTIFDPQSSLSIANSLQAYVFSTYTAGRTFSYSSATNIGIYTYSASTTQYGIIQETPAFSQTDGVLTGTSPPVHYRGNSSMLSNTWYNRLSDVRIQWAIDVYRSPRYQCAVTAWEMGTINSTTGSEASSTTRIRSTTSLPLSNTFNGGDMVITLSDSNTRVSLRFYDQAGNYIGAIREGSDVKYFTGTFNVFQVSQNYIQQYPSVASVRFVASFSDERTISDVTDITVIVDNPDYNPAHVNGWGFNQAIHDVLGKVRYGNGDLT